MVKKILIFIFLTIPILGIAQSDPLEVEISFSCEDLPIEKALVEISSASNINIAFDPLIITSENLVSISYNTYKIRDLLEITLEGSNLGFNVLGNQIIINPISSYQSSSIHISGLVLDDGSEERLVFASVISEKLGIGTETNEYGFFNIEVPLDEVMLSFNYLGYKKRTVLINSDTNNLIIRLKSNNQLNEILIEDYLIQNIRQLEETQQTSTIDMNSIPSLGGEPDIIRYVGMQTGVSTGADGIGGLNVRGGSADQNLILLDGVPVYNTGHTLGMFSIFNSSMIKSTRLYKNSFPAKYGGRLSSVLDIRTREGNLNEFKGEFALGTVAAKFLVEGPLVKGKSAFIISGRRSILDTWVSRASRAVKNLEGNNGELAYNFFDLNVKTQFKIGKNAGLFLNYYEGGDKFNDVTIIENRQDSTEIFEHYESNWNWGNRIASIRYTDKISSNHFVNSTLYYSRFSFVAFKNDRTEISERFQFKELIFDASLFQTLIEDIGFRLDFDFQANSLHQLQYGLDIINHRFKPSLVVLNEFDEMSSNETIIDANLLESFSTASIEQGSEINLYFQDRLRFNSNTDLKIGLRNSIIHSEGKTYLNLLPIVKLNRKLNQQILASISYSRTNQFLHLLTSSGLGLPTDIWLPSTDILKPQLSDQLGMEFVYHINSFGNFKAGAFYKKLRRILTLQEGPIFDISQSSNWEYDIPIGEGLNYGAEFSLAKQKGKFNYVINYTISKATRVFEEINQGKPYPFRYDRRHILNAVSSFKLNDNIEFTGNGTFMSGNWISLPTDFTSLGENSNRVIFIYSQKNNVQLDYYMRFDISVNIYNNFNWGNQKISLGIYNVLNRSNPLFYYFRRQSEDINKFERKQISLLPILPSLSYTLSF